MSICSPRPLAEAQLEAVPNVEVFRLRCGARAFLVAEGEMDFIEAVDGLQEAAVEVGLVNEIGQDEAQRIMADSITVVPRERRPDIEPPAPRQRHTAASTLQAAAWLAFQVRNAGRWRDFLTRHSPAERADILNHVNEIARRRAVQ